MKKNCQVITVFLLLFALPLSADHVILDDCIIDGSMSVGLDSVNGENFGFDTLRLKENNLRLHFDDTSVAAAFPQNDWRFIANDSANGGDSYMAIEDVTGGRIPFRVLAGAAANSLYIDSQGDVGFGTNNPLVELHSADGDTPTMRLEQNGASGWNPQTWDVAGNETNFFIRDVSNGSSLPFRIRPAAPSSSLEIQADGNISLHKSMTVGSTVGEVRITLPDDETDYPAVQVGEAFLSSGSGLASFSTNNFYNGAAWSANAEDRAGMMLQLAGSGFRVYESSAGAGVVPTFTQLMFLDTSGDLTTAGTVNGVSDRNAKEEIVPVDGGEILEKVVKLPISEWSYKKDDENVRHVGPMAQDFHASFGLGKDDKTISFHDPAGVALAAIQGLNKAVEDKDKRIAELEAQNKKLEKRLERIEKALQKSL